MKSNRKLTGICVALLSCMIVCQAFGVANGEKVKLSGLITDRTSEAITIKTASMGNVTVVLTDYTKVQQPKGAFGLRKKNIGMTALMPGLRVSVQGVGDTQNRVVASSITFSKGDLEVAEQIQAGLNPTNQAVAENKGNIAANQQGIEANKGAIGENSQQIAANRQEVQDVSKRFSELSDYDTKATAEVYFASGSTTIPDKDKTSLQELAHNAVNLTGYIIQVKGFADSSGNAALNQKLSMERAQGVIAYLLQDCNVPMRHVVAPGAMGTADPAATNETAQGRAENRRVEVKVLVNRGLAGQ
jgi:OOP family OmpA-OmpF porin